MFFKIISGEPSLPSSNLPFPAKQSTIKRGLLEKRIYSAIHAQREYETVRSESRQGIRLTEEEALRLDSLISPLLMKGQSLHHICVNHADEIMLNERSLYNYVDSGILTAKNIDITHGKTEKEEGPFQGG
ncbi:MAG: hypothetical protein QHH10_13055 [Peptococcaceae bacterium]|jgi:IS30 family transposase|nr:hypothetical protein [Peptococcaceae bacterium]MDH7526227.1 hypothetical protein [Peptococcaceae bacterium]